MHIMIDLETLGVTETAPILTIGATAFNHTIVDTYEQHIDLQSSLDNGAVIEADTVKWWLTKEQAAVDALKLDTKHQGLLSVLRNFSVWAEGYIVDGVWSKGAEFDIPIIEAAYRRAMLPTPWPVKSGRCLRTIANLFPDVEPTDPIMGPKHSAVYDAIYQTKHLLRIVREKGLKL